MRLRMIALVVVMIAGCAGARVPASQAEFEGQGRIRGTLFLGDRQLRDGWVEIVEWRASKDQCRFPNDCGLSVDALGSGEYWNPGRWIVVAPPVKGWIEPMPFDIMVRANELTTFQVKYRQATDLDQKWGRGLFGKEEADFPIGLGYVFENIWRQVIGGKYVAVYAGSHTNPDTFDPTADGVVLVVVIDPITWGHRYFPVEAPIPGPLRIRSVDGLLLTMVSPSGLEAIFDVDARQFL